MQHHKIWAWGLLLFVLGLNGVAYWATVWRKDVPLSLFCLLLGFVLLLASYRLWRRGH